MQISLVFRRRQYVLILSIVILSSCFWKAALISDNDPSFVDTRRLMKLFIKDLSSFTYSLVSGKPTRGNQRHVIIEQTEPASKSIDQDWTAEQLMVPSRGQYENNEFGVALKVVFAIIYYLSVRLSQTKEYIQISDTYNYFGTSARRCYWIQIIVIRKMATKGQI